MSEPYLLVNPVVPGEVDNKSTECHEGDANRQGENRLSQRDRHARVLTRCRGAVHDEQPSRRSLTYLLGVTGSRRSLRIIATWIACFPSRPFHRPMHEQPSSYCAEPARLRLCNVVHGGASAAFSRYSAAPERSCHRLRRPSAGGGMEIEKGPTREAVSCRASAASSGATCHLRSISAAPGSWAVLFRRKIDLRFLLQR